MKHSYYLFCAIMLMVATKSMAQQDPLFSQYMFNHMVLNPGAAGHREVLNISAMNRMQWVGFDGAPRTIGLSIQSPLTRAAGAGLLVMHDQTGRREATAIQLNGSYKIKLGKGRLGFGIRGGSYRFSNDWANLTARNQDDELLISYAPSNAINADFGLYYATESWFAGASITHLAASENSTGVSYMNQHFFFTAGKGFTLQNGVLLQPSLLLKATEGAPINADLNFNARFAGIFWTGLSVRNFNTLVALAALDISESFRVGYSYDLYLNTIGKHQSGTHEIYLGCSFKVLKGKTINPRYL